MGEFGDDAAHPIGHTGFKKAAPNHEHSNKKDQIVIDKTTKGILGTEDSCKNQDKERNDGRNRQWNLFPNKHNNNNSANVMATGDIAIPPLDRIGAIGYILKCTFVFYI